MGWNNQAVSLIILTEQTTGFSGIFGYSPTVGHGNLIFSLSAAAGTDPYGNAYPQGLNLGAGAITGIDFVADGGNGGIFIYSATPANGNLIGSWAGMAGTDAYGNAYPQGLNVTMGAISGTTFTGDNLVINGNGAFFYLGGVGATLSASVCGTSGNDPYGNFTLAGASGYSGSSAVSLAGGIIRFWTGSPSGGWTAAATVEIDGSGNLYLVASGNIYANGNLIS